MFGLKATASNAARIIKETGGDPGADIFNTDKDDPKVSEAVVTPAGSKTPPTPEPMVRDKETGELRPPKPRGRKPGSKAKSPRAKSDKKDEPEENLMLVPALKVIENIVPIFFPKWRAMDNQELATLSTAGMAVADRYMPDYFEEHKELILLGSVLSGIVGRRILE